MPRVLHLIYDDPANPWVAGGGAVRAFEIYRRLAERLELITIATGAYPGSADTVIDGVRYIRLGAREPYYWSRATYAFLAGRLLARGDYDVAIFDFSTYVPLRIPSDRPVGITVHHVTGISARERWGTVLGRIVAYQERKRLRQARYFSATSATTHEQLRAIVGDDAVVHRIGAGVPDSLFGLAHRDAGYLLYFGRLDWIQKGLDTLLEAAAILIGDRPGLRLKIAGRGRDADRVAQRAKALGIARNVEYLGAVTEPEREALFTGASLLLMPSRFEGFGMVAAEAMAAGVPVVASNADSLPEVVDAPSGGVLVDPGDAHGLAEATSRLLDDPAERERISRSARESAERFRWERVADLHLEFIEAISLGRWNQ